MGGKQNVWMDGWMDGFWGGAERRETAEETKISLDSSGSRTQVQEEEEEEKRGDQW